MKNESNTVAALSTPPGRGALAIIRITGEHTCDAFGSVIKEKSNFEKEEPRKIGLYRVTEKEGRIIDEITAVKYIHPRSFTGEDMVEIFCHGGPVIVGKILDRLKEVGVVSASRGEFSRRAFLNGKIDLLKAEGIKALIDCQTDIQLKSAQNVYQGKQRESIEKIRMKIIDVYSDLESRIEFEEEDDITEENLSGREELQQIIFQLSEELKKGERIRVMAEGLVIAIAGPANAGKSTLFNSVLGYERSIVHNIPGTTRDYVSEQLEYEGTTIKIFDCAGIRETEDHIEKKGIERTLTAVQNSHQVLWVTSAETDMDKEEEKSILNLRDKVLVIINKTDIKKSESKISFCRNEKIPFIEVSIKEKTNMDSFHTELGSVIKKRIETVPVPDLIGNERHYDIIKSIHENLQQTLSYYEREEIAAYYLKKAIEQFEEVCGYTTSEEVVNNIFGKFCIGK